MAGVQYISKWHCHCRHTFWLLKNVIKSRSTERPMFGTDAVFHDTIILQVEARWLPIPATMAAASTHLKLSSDGKRMHCNNYIQCESKNPPPSGVLTFLIFLTNGWEFLIDFLPTYYTFLSMLDYKVLFNYLQLWRSYAILSATTQFT